MSFSLRRKSLSAAMPFPGRALEIPPRCPSPPFQPIKALSPPPARHNRTKSTTAKLATATHHNVALPGLPLPTSGKTNSRRSGTIDVVVFVSPPTSNPPNLKSSLRVSTSLLHLKPSSTPNTMMTTPTPTMMTTTTITTKPSIKSGKLVAPPVRRGVSYYSTSPTSTNFSLPSSLRGPSSGPSSPVITPASLLGVPIVPRSSLDSLINTGRHRRMTTSEVRV